MTQKNLTIITLFVVVAGAVLINEFILRSTVKDQDREVASLGERFEPEQIKWEQELARSVSKETGKTLIGARPSLNEKFLFEALEGKYEASVLNGKLLKISLMTNQTALDLKTDNLIKKYASVFKDAAAFETNTDKATEKITLKNNDGKVIGKVMILRDDQGRVLNIEIQ